MRRNKNNINNRIDDKRNIKHSRRNLLRVCVGGANTSLDENFMFELHISTVVKIYSNWHIKTFISSLGDHDDAKQK